MPESCPQPVAVVEANPAEQPDDDPLYTAARGLVMRERKASLPLLRKQLDIGGGRASKLIEQLARDGIVSQPDERGRRTVVSV